MATQDRAPAGSTAPIRAPSPFRLLLIAWATTIAALSSAFAYASVAHFQGSTNYFLIRQDLPFVILFLVLIPALGAFPPLRWPALARSLAKAPALWVLGGAALVVVGGAGAGPWVTHRYLLSTDEFLANFDATIFAHGQLMAPVLPLWRPYVIALQPAYMLPTPGNVAWASGYLPIHAALRALAMKLGAASLLNPVLSGVAVIATYAVGRRIWPDDARSALLAAALLAVSPQLIVMSMTAYAMPAHLAFNMVWLWLFLRGGRLGHAGAIVVGFLASGLHELAFHPLFAAPFVLQLWLDRRWRLAGLYTVAYALICLFWIEYWPLEQHLVGIPPEAARAASGYRFFAGKVLEALGKVSFANFGAMAESLVRFVTWQAPLTAPLAVVSLIAAWRVGGTLRALVLGVALTLALALVVTPSQVHGWGYRYLHGLMGSVALLAAWSWRRLIDSLAQPTRTAANGALVVSCALSLLVFTPIRAWQAWSYIRPYAAATAAIHHAKADVVLVVRGGPATYDIGSVMQNDPYLAHPPLVMALVRLNEPKLRALCASSRVAWFQPEEGQRLGIDMFQLDPDPAETRLRSLLKTLRCGAPAV